MVIIAGPPHGLVANVGLSIVRPMVISQKLSKIDS